MRELHAEDIPFNEVCRYLGYRAGKQPDEGVTQIIRSSIELIANLSQPRAIYRAFHIEAVHNGVKFVGTRFVLQGNQIQRHLEKSSRCILMAATLGAQVDKLILRTQVVDMVKALVLDSCATAAIECVCDDTQTQAVQTFAHPGQSCTSRYSPGYGDLPLSAQKDFIDLLDTGRQIGLSLSSSLALIPSKSVTAVIGIQDGAGKRIRQSCQMCSQYGNCLYRKEGDSCEA